jgi:hypothetical protein
MFKFLERRNKYILEEFLIESFKNKEFLTNGASPYKFISFDVISFSLNYGAILFCTMSNNTTIKFELSINYNTIKVIHNGYPNQSYIVSSINDSLYEFKKYLRDNKLESIGI